MAAIRAAGGSAELHFVELTGGNAVAAFADTVESDYDVLDIYYNHAACTGRER